MAFGEVTMPVTEHSAQILVGSWPSQSVMAWSGYAMEFTQAANNLFTQLNTQYDIKDILAPMEGAFIDSARALEAGRQTALQNRIEGYRYLAKQAHWAANELHSTKADLVEIVNKAEEDIQTARDNAEKAKSAVAAIPGAALAIEGELQANIAAIVAGAKGKAQARDLQGAGTVTALSTDIGKWAVPFVNQILPESGGVPDLGNVPTAPPAAPAPALPQPQGGGAGAKPVDYTGTGDTLKQAAGTQTPQNNPNEQRQFQQGAYHQPNPVDPNQAGTPPKSTTPAASAPSPGSGGSSPGSVIGQMMRPISSGSSSPAAASPASSGAGSGLGNSAMNPAGAQSGQFANANANATGAAAANAGRAPGLASLGSGVAESSARMASGAISGAAGGLGAVGNVGNQVAQNVATAAAQAPQQAAAAANPAALTTPAAATPAGGAPMAMMPPAGGAAGATPVTPVSSTPAAGPAAPTTPAAAQPVSSGGPAPVASSPPGAQVAPLAMPHSGIQAIGADGATSDVLFEQAMDAGHDVIAAMIAQTTARGYIPIEFAVSLIWERTGAVAAWMATSEGASYIPLGARVPQDVRLAVTDPVVGRELCEATAAAGGTNPLEVVVRHAEAREMAAPGARVLAIASSLPMAQVIDWAGAVGARPVSVDPKKLGPAADLDGHMVHRCAVAMPWEWRQANAFTEQDRLRVAARHMHMAATAGHLSGAACEKVMRLFEERKPIDDALWEAVRNERFIALVEYEMANRARGEGGSEPARALATARAAEVIECLRHYDTAEGCADLLYATRLAGAPLSPAAAVA